MKIFNVMLEGMEGETNGFFITVEVAAPTKIMAGELAICEVEKAEMGFL